MNAATKLCEGGVCHYKEKDKSKITNQWLARAVAPAIRRLFREGVKAILAQPLIWAVFEAGTVDLVPSDLTAKLTTTDADADADDSTTTLFAPKSIKTMISRTVIG